jgi:ankyrin repeat protein
VEQLYDAIVQKDVNAARELVTTDTISILRTRDCLGWTFMHHAAFHGSLDLVAFLLQQGLGVNEESIGEDACTPLHLAASRQDHATIDFLVSLGASLTATDSSGRTALVTFVQAVARRRQHPARRAGLPTDAEVLNSLKALLLNPAFLWDCSPLKKKRKGGEDEGEDKGEGEGVRLDKAAVVVATEGVPSKGVSAPWNHIGSILSLLIVTAEYEVAYATLSIAAMASPDVQSVRQIRKILLMALRRRRAQISHAIIGVYSSILFCDSSSGVECFSEALCAAVENGLEGVTIRLLAYGSESAVSSFLRARSSEPLLLAPLCGDTRILVSLLKNGYQSRMLRVTRNAPSPPREDFYLMCSQVFSPLAVCCLVGDARSAQIMLSALPAERLTSQDILCEGVSPLVCCCFSGSLETLLMLRRRMLPDEFSIACRDVDSMGMRPITSLLYLVKLCASKGMSKKLDVVDDGVLRTSENLLSMCAILVEEEQTFTVSRPSLRANEIQSIWKARCEVIERRIETVEAEASALLKTMSAEFPAGELHRRLASARGTLYEWMSITSTIDSAAFIPSIKTLFAKESCQEYRQFAKALLALLGTNARAKKKFHVQEGEDPWKAICKPFRGTKIFSDQQLGKLVSDLKAARDVFIDFETYDTARVVLHRLSLSQNFLRAMAKGERSSGALKLLFDWCTVLLKEASELYVGQSSGDSSAASSPSENSLSPENARALNRLASLENERIALSDIKSNLYMIKVAETEELLVSLCSSDPCSESFLASYSLYTKILDHCKMKGLSFGRNSTLGETKESTAVNPRSKLRSLQEELSALLIQKDLVPASWSVVDTFGQSSIMMLASLQLWNAAVLLLAKFPPVRATLVSNKTLHKIAFLGDVKDILRAVRRPSTESYGVVTEQPLSWEKADLSRLCTLSLFELAVMDNQQKFAREYLRKCGTYLEDWNCDEMLALTDAHDCVALTFSTAIERADCTASRIPYMHVDLNTDHRVLKFLPDIQSFDNRVMVGVKNASQRTSFSAKRRLTSGRLRRQTKMLRQYSEAARRSAVRLITTMLGDGSPSLNDDWLLMKSTADSLEIIPQLDGVSAGLCLSTSGSVVLMDGSCVPLEAFQNDVRLLPLALPAPALPRGAFCSGHSMLHSVVLGDPEYTRIVSGIAGASGVSFLCADMHGRTPLLNAIVSGNVSIAARALASIVSTRTKQDERENEKVRVGTDSIPAPTPVGGLLEVVRGATVALPPRMDLRRLFLANAKKENAESMSRYKIILDNYSTLAGNWPQQIDRLLLQTLVRMRELWKIISDDSARKAIQDLYSVPVGVVESVKRARQVLSLLSLPLSKIGPSSAEDPTRALPAEMEYIYGCPTPQNIKAGVSLRLSNQLRDVLVGWLVALREPGARTAQGTRGSTLNEWAFLLHTMGRSLNNFAETGFRTGSEASAQDWHQGLSLVPRTAPAIGERGMRGDTTNAMYSGKGLPDHIVADIRSHYNATLRARSLSGSQQTDRDGAAFLSHWARNKAGVQATISMARIVLEFGRNVCLARSLVAASTQATSPVAPTMSSDHTVARAGECAFGLHALDVVLSEQITAERNERLLLPVLSAVDSGHGGELASDAFPLHRQAFDASSTAGVLAKVTALYPVSKEDFQYFLSVRAEFCSEFTELRSRLLRALCAMATALTQNESANFLTTLISAEGFRGTASQNMVASARFSLSRVSKEQLSHISSLLKLLNSVRVRDVVKSAQSEAGVKFKEVEKLTDEALSLVSSWQSSNEIDIQTLQVSKRFHLFGFLLDQENKDRIVGDEKENTMPPKPPSRSSLIFEAATKSIVLRRTEFTIRALLMYLRCISGIHKTRALYSLDIDMWLEDKFVDPLVALCFVRRDENMVVSTLDCCRHLLSLGSDPMKLRGGISPFLIAAMTGRSDILALFISHEKAKGTPNTAMQEDAYKCLLWYVLMACPSGRIEDDKMKRINEDYDGSAFMIANYYKSSRHFPPFPQQPTNTFMTCLDLATLKQLPRITQFLFSSENSKSFETGHLSAVHFLVLSQSPSIAESLSHARAHNVLVNLRSLLPVEELEKDRICFEDKFKSVCVAGSSLVAPPSGSASDAPLLVEMPNTQQSLAAALLALVPSPPAVFCVKDGIGLIPASFCKQHTCPLNTAIRCTIRALLLAHPNKNRRLYPPSVKSPPNYTWSLLDFALAHSEQRFEAVAQSPRLWSDAFGLDPREDSDSAMDVPSTLVHTSPVLHLACFYAAPYALSWCFKHAEFSRPDGMVSAAMMNRIPFGATQKECSPFEAALWRGNFDCASFLLSKQQTKHAPYKIDLTWEHIKAVCVRGGYSFALQLLRYIEEEEEEEEEKEDTAPNNTSKEENSASIHLSSNLEPILQIVCRCGARPAYGYEQFLEALLRRKETDPAALDARGLSPLDVSIATNNVIASQMLISRLPKERRSAIRLTQKVRSFLRKKKQIHK